MNRTKSHRSPFRRQAVLHAIVCGIAMCSFALNSANVRAATFVPSEYRIVGTDDKFKDTWQYAFAFEMRPPRRLRARQLELALGTISTPEETRPFVSLGPVWRLPRSHNRFFVDLGFSPTIIAGSTLNGRDLGGNFHFTSSAAFGAVFGRDRTFSLSLRIQHTSNGGLNNTNPGLDMIGLTFSYDPRR